MLSFATAALRDDDATNNNNSSSLTTTPPPTCDVVVSPDGSDVVGSSLFATLQFAIDSLLPTSTPRRAVTACFRAGRFANRSALVYFERAGSATDGIERLSVLGEEPSSGER